MTSPFQSTSTKSEDELLKEAVKIFRKEMKSLESYKDAWDVEKIVQDCKKTADIILGWGSSFHGKLKSSENYFGLQELIWKNFKEIVQEESVKVKQRKIEVEGKLKDLQGRLCETYKTLVDGDIPAEFLQSQKKLNLEMFSERCKAVPAAVREEKIGDLERRHDELEKEKNGSGVGSADVQDSDGYSSLLGEGSEGEEINVGGLGDNGGDVMGKLKCELASEAGHSNGSTQLTSPPADLPTIAIQVNLLLLRMEKYLGAATEVGFNATPTSISNGNDDRSTSEFKTVLELDGNKNFSGNATSYEDTDGSLGVSQDDVIGGTGVCGVGTAGYQQPVEGLNSMNGEAAVGRASQSNGPDLANFYEDSGSNESNETEPTKRTVGDVTMSAQGRRNERQRKSVLPPQNNPEYEEDEDNFDDSIDDNEDTEYQPRGKKIRKSRGQGHRLSQDNSSGRFVEVVDEEGVKKYKCTACEKILKRKQGHKECRAKYMDLPFDCENCKRKFSTKITLKEHLNPKGGEKGVPMCMMTWKCDDCQLTFASSFERGCHMYRFHRQK